MDHVTLLIGSIDTSVKVWDAITGACLRTYAGHVEAVTGISVTDDDTTFVTSSADRTVKVWMLTTVPPVKPSVALDEAPEMNDCMCRGLDPD
jgi:WD40 repeat protein